jgi:hypothetical protein
MHRGVHLTMVHIIKSKAEKTSKGYRLNISTHKLIDKIQIILNADQNTVITKACKKLYSELKKTSK